MSIEVKVPELPESIADAEVLSWHKKVGDFVKRDEVLVDIETDKVVLDVPAPRDGVLAKIVEPQGSVVVAGQLLAVLKEADEKAALSHNVVEKKPADMEVEEKTAVETVITPSAKKLIAEHQLDSKNIQGSGSGGRILKEDVLRYLNAQTAAEKPQQKTSAEKEAAPLADDPSGRVEKRVPMTRLRARVAERLLEAQHNAAILTTFNEVNMQPVMDLRTKYKEAFEKRYDVKLGFMSFFIKATIEALKQFPAVNASIDGNDIVYHGYFDIGVAVSSPRGLVVPVIRNADQLSLAQIEQAIIDYAQKARDNSLSIEELQGGTFTLSNGGVFGSLLSTPILNPPQSGILGMHKIQKRPVAEGDDIVIRPMMYLALSYDHRIIDGREAVQFLVTLKDALEDPARMIIGI